MEEKQQPKLFWTVRDLAELLGVSKSLIYDRIYKQEIPCKRLGARILIPAAYVDALTTM